MQQSAPSGGDSLAGRSDFFARYVNARLGAAPPRDMPVAEAWRPNRLVQPGEPAPDFALPSVQTERTESLSERLAAGPLLLALLRPLSCPFCRRHLVHLGATREQLKAHGVEILAVVGSDRERARRYVRFSPIAVPLAADPELSVYRAYGVPRAPGTEEPATQAAAFRAVAGIPINPTGELPAPAPFFAAHDALNALDGFTSEPDDIHALRHLGLMTAHFLIDRGGIVRWTSVEGESGPRSVLRFPTDADILAAVGAL